MAGGVPAGAAISSGGYSYLLAVVCPILLVDATHLAAAARARHFASVSPVQVHNRCRLCRAAALDWSAPDSAGPPLSLSIAKKWLQKAALSGARVNGRARESPLRPGMRTCSCVYIIWRSRAGRHTLLVAAVGRQ